MSESQTKDPRRVNGASARRTTIDDCGRCPFLLGCELHSLDAAADRDFEMLPHKPVPDACPKRGETLVWPDAVTALVPERQHDQSEPLGAILEALVRGRRLELFLDNDLAEVTDITDQPDPLDDSPEGEAAFMKWLDSDFETWKFRDSNLVGRLAFALGMEVRHA